MARPSGYKQEFAGQAQKLCLLGATDDDLADFFGVEQRTINRWKVQHAGFCQSLKIGKAELDNQVERRLFERAMGYSHPSVKVFCTNGMVTEVPYTEHFPPDTTACIFWLKNRQPAQWRDAKEINVRKVESLQEEQARLMAESYIESKRRSSIGAVGADPLHNRLPSGLPPG